MSKNININDISKKDYESLIIALKSLPNSDKLLYSLKELLAKMKKKPNIELDEIYKSSTYEIEMKYLMDFLANKNLLKIKFERDFSGRQIRDYHTLVLSTSFKDFLKMEI